ncbi:MAG: CapA family protein [Pseudomonadales bacterium]|nr:CapA family protein [Pseudomonadales bacterium]
MLHHKIAQAQPRYWLLICIILIALGVLGISYVQEQLPKQGNVEILPEPVLKVPETQEGEVADAVEDESITLLFGGDLQFDRHIRQQSSFLGGYQGVFDEPLKELFLASDGVIANLEGPITEFDSVSVGSVVGSTNNYLFTFSPQVAPVLKQLNFVAVNLGNNHILNFGPEGLLQTQQFLNEAGVAYWGNTGGETWLEDSFLELSIKKKKFLFVNFNEFLWSDEDELVEELHTRVQAGEFDYVVVYTHWGVEYQKQASERYQGLARRLVSAGADIVIGSHPHVIQQSETVAGAPIYYSLGNFVFDQYFEPAVRNGLLLEVNFEGSIITTKEIPIYLEGTGKTILLEQN